MEVKTKDKSEDHRSLARKKDEREALAQEEKTIEEFFTPRNRTWWQVVRLKCVQLLVPCVGKNIDKEYSKQRSCLIDLGNDRYGFLTHDICLKTYTDGSFEKVKENHIQLAYNEKDNREPLPADFVPNISEKAEVITDETFIQDALEEHNYHRKNHKDTPVLTINRELCQIAQGWANKIAKDGILRGSGTGHGENCFWASNPIDDGKIPVEVWATIGRDGWNKNHGNPNGEVKGAGIYTQMIWKGTKEFGIAKATGADGSTYIVAEYSPPGNIIGEYKENMGEVDLFHLSGWNEIETNDGSIIFVRSN